MTGFCMPSSRRWVPLNVLLLTVLATGLLGCNWFKPLAFILPDPTRTVPAEFAHLEGSATVLVWAPPETTYTYPYLRLELASHIVNQLRAQFPEEIAFTDSEQLEQYLDRRNVSALNPEQVGRDFDTRFVIYLEVLEFSLRDPQMPDFLQGRIRASVVVYDLTDQDLPPRVFELDPLSTLVPDSPVRFTQNNALLIRKATYEVFSGDVAKKFYEHEEVIE